MYSPRTRTGRTPGGVKPIVAALALALMGMGGVALAAPKADPGPPEQAQGNGPPPQAQENGPPPQAQDHAPAPQANAKAKGQRGAGKPAELPPAQPPQAGGESNPGAGQSRRGGLGHGRPAPGEIRGLGLGRSNRGNCQSAACQGGAPEPSAGASGGEQPPAAGPQVPIDGDVVGGSEERPGDDQAGTTPGEHRAGAPEPGSVLGANQGGGDEVEAAQGSFDGALPFTGFEVVLLAGIGALLWLLGARLRRSTA